MEKERRKRGFFGRLIVFLLSVLAVVGLIAMTMSVLSSYVDPCKFVWLSFFGLAFWAILLYNLVVLALLLLMWSRRAWIVVVALLIAVPGLVKSISLGRPQEGGTFRVMTYNVHGFKDGTGEEQTRLEMATIMAKMVRERQPDVFCLQEFAQFLPKVKRQECVEQLGEMLSLPYYYYHTTAYFGSNVIFSKYPLTALEEDTPFAQENEYGSVAKVDAGEKGVFYVMCSHLTSFQLLEEEIQVFSGTSDKEQVQQYGKSIVKKLIAAYERRSQLVAKMMADMPHDGRALILCGDFNDTPLSFTYHRIKQAGFSDGFVKAGRGIGHTYAGKLPLLRIDYIWGNERIQPTSFKRIKYKGSDHYPVMMDFNLTNGL